MSEYNVKTWETRNDANHNNRHIQVNEVEFFAFPYQDYLTWGSTPGYSLRVSPALSYDKEAKKIKNVCYWQVHKNTRGGFSECLESGKEDTKEGAAVACYKAWKEITQTEGK